MSVMESENSYTKCADIFWRYIWPCGIGAAGGLGMKNIEDASLGVAVVILMFLFGLAPRFPRVY